jgi:tyrosinase
MGGSGTKDNDWVVTTGPFAYQSGRWAISFSEGFDPDFGHDGPELRRAIGMEPTVKNVELKTLAKVERIHEILELPFDGSPWNKMPTPLFNKKNAPDEDPREYNAKKHNFFRNRFERDLHNVGHRFVGRTMLRGTAPNDPAFFLHHSNVDRIWSKWQDKHLGESYVPLLPIPGVPGCSIDEQMYGFDRTVRSVLNRFSLGYDYDGMASDDGFMPGEKPSIPPSDGGGGGGHGHGHGH